MVISIAMLVYQRVSVRKPSKDEVFIVLWWCLSSQLVLPQKGVRVSLPQGQRRPQVCRRSWPGAVHHEIRKITRLQWHRIGQFAHIKKLHMSRKLRIRFAVFFQSMQTFWKGRRSEWRSHGTRTARNDRFRIAEKNRDWGRFYFLKDPDAIKHLGEVAIVSGG